MTRQSLDLGSSALGDLAALAEAHFGVDVSLSPLGTVDGLCVHSGSAALIVASSDYPDGHLRFTLAHELAHHLLGDPREVIEEDEHAMYADTSVEWRANAFAGHLLMPERGIHDVVNGLGEPAGDGMSDFAVLALMEHFAVSRKALVYQLNHFDLMTFRAGQQLQDSRSVTSAGVSTEFDLVAQPRPTRP